MKNITRTIVALFTIFAVSCSTDDVQDRPLIQGINAPVLSAPDDSSIYVLQPENMSQQAERFVWTSANYGGDVAVNYEVQIDVIGGDFSNPAVLGGANSANQVSVSVETLNNACLTLGADPFVASSYDVRVKSAVSGFEPMYSEKITIIVTTYTTDLPKLWIPGSYQSESGYGDADWTHSAAAQLAADAFGSTKFEGYLYLANNVVADSDNGFKFSSQGDWSGTNYGDDGTFSDNLSPTGGNIGGNAGYYRVKVDTEGLTYNLQPVTWGIIGAATPTGWDSDTNMTYNPATKKWQIVIALTVEKFKFRYNDTWNVGDAQWNLGLFDASKTGENYGGETMSYGGGDISVTTAGTYLVELDLSNPRDYKFTMTLQ